jgi:carbonic anhydrase/acetyltransferase-like protein (isoleucine patch superfamily)
MPIYALGDRVPHVAEDAFVHPDAVVIGDVSIGSESSIWPNVVLRGDFGRIEIGRRTSIQDGTVIHATRLLATIVGDGCVVGHNVHLEGCVVEDGVLVGSASAVLHKVIVRSGAVVGAGALLLEGTEVPTHAMAIGVPAKVRLDAATADYTSENASNYVAMAKRYQQELRLIG